MVHLGGRLDITINCISSTNIQDHSKTSSMGKSCAKNGVKFTNGLSACTLLLRFVATNLQADFAWLTKFLKALDFELFFSNWKVLI
uniref:Uncharacterized protein n=1 Tax=Megaselia scalaris TaxID=36166 RepID=T1H4G9_MEGSC